MLNKTMCNVVSFSKFVSAHYLNSVKDKITLFVACHLYRGCWVIWPFVQRNVEVPSSHVLRCEMEEPALNTALEVAMTDLTGTE